MQDVITQKYLTSSKSLDEIIPRDDVKIHYDIFAFGTEEDMASLEVRELNKVKAIKNPEFFNKNAGGGLYVVPSKNNKKTNKTKNHIKKMREFQESQRKLEYIEKKYRDNPSGNTDL